MLWEHKLQASIFTAFSSSPKLSQVFLYLNRNTENMFSISFRNTVTRKKENNLVTLIIKIEILFARTIIMSTARASSCVSSEL